MGIRPDPSTVKGTLIAKRLAQSYPGALSNTSVYTSQASTIIIIQNVLMCNTTGVGINARVYLVPNGGTPALVNALFYDYEVPANTTWNKTVHVVMDTDGDEIVVWVSAQGVSFTISGSEVFV